MVNAAAQAQEVLATLQSHKQARRYLDQMAAQTQMLPASHNDCGAVYESKDGSRFWITKKAVRQWQIVKEPRQAVAAQLDPALERLTEDGKPGANARLTFTVLLERDEDGYVVASCPALPGCHTQGKSREEALANIREAIGGYIASMRRHGEAIPVEDAAQVEVEAAA